MPSKYRHPDMDKVVQKIRAQRGLATEIARRCKVSRAAVYQWKTIPVQHMHDVAAVTGMRVEELRPDIFRPKRRRA